ncbi:MAG: sulfotransferase family 2 domain-containing protein, partial [Paracoccaceae bacterium]
RVWTGPDQHPNSDCEDRGERDGGQGNGTAMAQAVAGHEIGLACTIVFCVGGRMAVIGANFIFIHVPKSAGQSVNVRLGGASKSLPGHTPLFHLSAEERAGRFAFGFVRNPWDRMVSIYSFLCKKKLRAHESAEYQSKINDMGFTHRLLEDAYFQQQDQEWASDGLQPLQRRSQFFWLEGCDFIGQVERLEQDFATVAHHIGLKPGLLERLGLQKPFGHRNKSRRGEYQGYYTDKAREFVARHFAAEIDRFDYRF